MGKRGHRLRSGIISYGFLILGSVVMLVPFIWMILTSFKTYAEAVKIPVVWFPAEWNLDDSQISDYQQAGMGGYDMGTGDSEYL